MNITRIHSEWTTIEKIARKQGISDRTAYRWLKSGKIESRTDITGTVYRVSDTQMSVAEMSVAVARQTALEAVTEMSVVSVTSARLDALEASLGRLERLETENAELKAAHLEMKAAHAELLLRLESIEHATGWHVAVDGILEKRRKKMAKLRR